MNVHSSFHEGERAVQERAGESAIADRNIAVLSDTVIAGARPFIAKQFMAALASVDAEGQVWSSLVFGKPGFLHTDSGRTIQIDLPEKERDLADPLWENLAFQPDIGMLFIELGSRRRYRVNGTVQQLDASGAEVAIREAYPNCPKYIQRRHLRQLGEPALPVQAAHGTVLRGTVEDIIRQADTVFVASRHSGSGADASHRGGNPGFVKVVDETTLRIPDYHGNSLFNTLGNIAADPHAGLCIPDFAHGQLLQLTGTASVQWDQDDPEDETGGTRRYWEFKVQKWILRDTPQQLEWEYLDASPFNPGTPY
ncbi:pyridoxamine 5'-phosphate oxidase family protein [Pseudoduganella aquatica]|uniref:Pyridoxamine 5'-phosphate oxidase n=1 Tax=Pseudoduganella aquatica TaxID=2660641 RepID=A0A7X4HA75_9BURK|nr:pyridoxamine 5'-phosphate oxidase family protein [Pseudoduganella aquatica]MYN07506.1 pyridoxamine 5'-phosphate oxidase [Pseudoduganella aquatica]